MRNPACFADCQQFKVICFWLVLVALATVASPSVRADLVVVPNANATVDGNSMNSSPLGPTSYRYQQIFDASQFPGPMLITAFAQRPDASQVGPSSASWVHLDQYFSTTTTTVAGLSINFADNIGPDNTLVYSGPLVWNSANQPGPGNTRQFDLVQPFTTSFYYDPSQGNLLFDSQATTLSGVLMQDSVLNDPTVKILFAAGSSTATTGTLSPSGIVYQFTFQAIPEPSAPAMLAVCGGLTVVLVRAARYIVTVRQKDLRTNEEVCVSGGRSGGCAGQLRVGLERTAKCNRHPG
jgi:hypothetical protein